LLSGSALNGKRRRKMIMREFDPGRGVTAAAIVLAACSALIPSALGQAVPQAQSSSYSKAAAYEVISVKPSKSGCDLMSYSSTPGRGRLVAIVEISNEQDHKADGWPPIRKLLCGKRDCR
jgi:starvation-inducible outer membrane lipoprotein